MEAERAAHRVELQRQREQVQLCQNLRQFRSSCCRSRALSEVVTHFTARQDRQGDSAFTSGEAIEYEAQERLNEQRAGEMEEAT